MALLSLLSLLVYILAYYHTGAHGLYNLGSLAPDWHELMTCAVTHLFPVSPSTYNHYTTKLHVAVPVADCHFVLVPASPFIHRCIQNFTKVHILPSRRFCLISLHFSLPPLSLPFLPLSSAYSLLFPEGMGQDPQWMGLRYYARQYFEIYSAIWRNRVILFWRRTVNKVRCVHNGIIFGQRQDGTGLGRSAPALSLLSLRGR